MLTLLEKKKSIMISSSEELGVSTISYSPFIMVDKKIYIYISKTAPHYRNILNSNTIDIMAIEDEVESKSIWARERIVFRCKATVEENQEGFIEEFERIHGSNIISVLRTLDFDVFALEIIDGRVIRGFGQAFKIEIVNGEWEFNQITGDGHGKGKK